MLLPLTQGFFSVIDECDASAASSRFWQVDLSRGSDDPLKYARTNVGTREAKRTILLHQFIWNLRGMPDSGVDHRDNDGLNCRFDNLRAATTAQNNYNTRRRRDNTSGFKGVGWVKSRRRFRARITTDGKTKVIGFFRSAEEAHAAYAKAAIVAHGDFARSE